MGGVNRLVFIQSKLLLEQRHTVEMMADSLQAVMESPEFRLTADGVDGIIMENAKDCNKASKVLRERFPHLTTYGCGAHAANLLAGDNCKVTMVEVILQQSQTIAKFFLNKNIPKVVLHCITREVLGKHLMPLRYG